MGRRGRTAPQPDHPACHCLWAALPERDWPPNPTFSCLQLEEPKGVFGGALASLEHCLQAVWMDLRDAPEGLQAGL